MTQDQKNILNSAQEAIAQGRYNGDGNISSAIIYGSTVIANALNQIAWALTRQR